MKKENKILFLLVLFSLFVILVIELTSPTSLYRDPYMFRHLDAAEFILEKEKVTVAGEDLTQENFVGWITGDKSLYFFAISKIYLFSDSIISFGFPVVSGAVLSILSGLDIYFLFNHFYFLIFISALSFFILFREIFKSNKLALGLSLIVILFPFETLYYKISVHGWHFVRVFSSVTLFFLIKLIKSGFSFKSKHFFLSVVFAFLGVYSDKSGFALVLIPVFLFFLVFFFFEKKSVLTKKKHLNFIFLLLFFLLFFSVLTLFPALFFFFEAMFYNFLNLNFIPSFFQPNLPFSEFYLQKDFFYIFLKYFIPVLTVLSFLVLNFSLIKKFILKDKIMKSYVFSQILFYFFVVVPLLFSFAFISSSGATMIFFFLCLLSFVGLTQMQNKKLKYFLISFFFVFVLIVPLVYYTQTPQFKYEQFNEKHLSSVQWIGQNLDETSIIYSDVKMAKAIALKTRLTAVNHSLEFGFAMENEIIPIYFSDENEKVFAFFKDYNLTHLVLTKEMSELMVEPANELLKPATNLNKFDSLDSFDKIFENNQVRVYSINFQEK
ncbi:MAG: hypothetical protein COT90_00100 [Candidatus Diapherotrites archaeon CG10_big_fil_rev_8_21_14_0_10_31_34]|nr:MAG: hypothetical protein COT90_00100 [Candidatus Diapherotrites archaeon CG10_big_fil_rev_8_21_14_0_10_31_34]